jgi:hypothetical protein
MRGFVQIVPDVPTLTAALKDALQEPAAQ